MIDVEFDKSTIETVISDFNKKIEIINSPCNKDIFDQTLWLRIELKAAILALEKQLPKSPDYEGDGYSEGKLVYDTWICPNCGKYYEVGYDNYDYCPNCGQHIQHADWEVE